MQSSTIIDRLFWRLGVLNPASPVRVHPRILGGIVGYHLLALLACIPWLYSGSGLAWSVAGLYLFGTLGINIGYHRLLAPAVLPARAGWSMLCRSWGRPAGRVRP